MSYNRIEKIIDIDMVTRRGKKYREECVFLLFGRIYCRGRGPAFVREPRHFSVPARLPAILCLLRGVVQFRSDAFSIEGTRVTTRALTSLPRESSFQFNNRTSAAARSGGLG